MSLNNVGTKEDLALLRNTNERTMNINTILENYISELKKIYKNHLRTVILYGSYARGDFDEDSDIDIMILVDMEDADIINQRTELSNITYDFNMEHDVDVEPITINESHFLNWLNAYPFYKNVDVEGVKLFNEKDE